MLGLCEVQTPDYFRNPAIHVLSDLQKQNFHTWKQILTNFR